MVDHRLLLVGLGNPGKRYVNTRHNAGFQALDYFARAHGLVIRTEKMQGEYCTAMISGRKVLLLKPMTFMNRSGECVRAFVDYFHITPGNILVIHDDLDLSPGRLKMVRGGGAGGHNGIRSLIEHLHTNDFSRLKIGIGHPRDNRETAAIPVEQYVLAPFSPGQVTVFARDLEDVSRGVDLFLEQGISTAMNSVNCSVGQ